MRAASKPQLPHKPQLPLLAGCSLIHCASSKNSKIFMSAKIKWSLEADYIQACNCDYGCPCEFEAPPTQGYCEGLGAYRISRGRFGDLALDGLGLCFVLHFPKAMHLGNGTVGWYFDERANPQQ